MPTLQRRPGVLIVLLRVPLESGEKVRDPGGDVVADQAVLDPKLLPMTGLAGVGLPGDGVNYPV
jgi:hypothetical protein